MTSAVHVFSPEATEQDSNSQNKSCKTCHIILDETKESELTNVQLSIERQNEMLDALTQQLEHEVRYIQSYSFNNEGCTTCLRKSSKNIQILNKKIEKAGEELHQQVKLYEKTRKKLASEQ